MNASGKPYGSSYNTQRSPSCDRNHLPYATQSCPEHTGKSLTTNLATRSDGSNAALSISKPKNSSLKRRNAKQEPAAMSAVHRPNPTHYSHDDITLKPLVLPPTRRESSSKGTGNRSPSRKTPRRPYRFGKGVPPIDERREDPMRGVIAVVAVLICCMADPLAPLTNLQSGIRPADVQVDTSSIPTP